MVSTYWNKAAFAMPTASALFGNLGRNALRGPDLWQWDFSVNKRFRLPWREGMALQFRSEFFNLLNRTNFGQPAANLSNSDFGTIRTSLPPRQIQFALKFIY
jgi:hypothetical protein